MSDWVLSPARSLTLDRPRIVAILNTTPDSFHDGGMIRTPDDALAAADRAISSGADALDVGGESTRPGAQAVHIDVQIRRVVPAIEAIRRRFDTPITIDTTSAVVARAAIEAGADAINDTSAGLDDPAMLSTAAELRRGLILMHRLRKPAVDSYSDQYIQPPQYADVVSHISSFLADRTAAAVRAGVPREAIVIDPGLGFGKTVEQNLELIRRTGEFAALGFPVLSGLSRKSFVGRAQGIEESTPAQRLPGTIALTVVHLLAGARLFRIHDVAPIAQALRAAAQALPS